MCGIAGYVGWSTSREKSAENLFSMCKAIHHRGPDDEGHFITDGVALGMRRLSIIDLEGGRQPIANEDGMVNVVFNGEIYNHQGLMEDLIRDGHTFSTRCDTETLVHLYEDMGEDLVHELNGMFGIAIWDERKRSLFLARDRLGIKPIFYWEHDGGLAFASELGSLFALDRFAPALDPTALAWYMAMGYVPEPLTVFEGVRKLPPGHHLTWTEDGGVRIKKYWDPAAFPEIDISEEEAVEEIRALLRDSVRMRMIADVPLGAFLSGGTDSSAVVATMAQQSTIPVRTFSIGFDEEEFNEAAYAAELAQELGTEHTELIVRPDADELIEDLVASFGEPFADSSAIPTFLVSRLACQHVKVALSGDGGDELFSGYTRYTDLEGRSELSPAILRGLLGAVGRRLPQGAYGRNRILDLSRSRRGRYASTVAMALSPAEGGVTRPEVSGLLPPLENLLDPWFDQLSDRDFRSQIALVDLMTYLPGDILTKVDRMSMACSLEARVPLLDHRMVEFAASLPSHLKMREGVGKWILRKAIAGLLPKSVLQRPKMGFAMPLNRWLRGELKYRTEELLAPNSELNAYLDRGAVARVVDEHTRGRRDHSHLLWRILVLDLWLKQIGSRFVGS